MQNARLSAVSKQAAEPCDPRRHLARPRICQVSVAYPEANDDTQHRNNRVWAREAFRTPFFFLSLFLLKNLGEWKHHIIPQFEFCPATKQAQLGQLSPKGTLSVGSSKAPRWLIFFRVLNLRQLDFCGQWGALTLHCKRRSLPTYLTKPPPPHFTIAPHQSSTASYFMSSTWHR